jgi:lantibiotic modifying enzyme
VGIFAGYLFRNTLLPEFTELCGWIRESLELLLEEPGIIPANGVFDGLSGLIFSRALLLRLTGNSPTSLPPRTMRILRDRIESNSNCDLISGAAGAVIGLQRYHQLVGDQQALPVIASAVDVIRRTVRQHNDGAFWTGIHVDREITTGVSHGTAGCGWALAEWAKLTGDPSAASLARKAFAYERSRIEARQIAGPRPQEDYMSWCHGLPGIAAAAACSRTVIGNRTAEGFHAITRLDQHGDDEFADDSLCHGSMGLFDYAIDHGASFDAMRMMDRIVRRAEERGGWRCGLPGNAFTSGLMCGLSGIGLGLLRAWDPSAIPSILSLRLP